MATLKERSIRLLQMRHTSANDVAQKANVKARVEAGDPASLCAKSGAELSVIICLVPSQMRPSSLPAVLTCRKSLREES